MALGWKPVAAAVAVERGRAALDRHDDDGALAHLGEAVRLNPADPRATFLLARAHRTAGRLDEYSRLLDRAARLGADPERVRRERTLALAQTGRLDGPDGAMARLPDLLTDNRGDVDAICGAYVKGLCARQRFDEAGRLLAVWAEADPGEPEVDFRRGLIAQSRRDHAAAAELFESVLARAPWRTDAALRLAVSRRALNDPGAAATLLRGVADRHPGDAEVWSELGTALREAGDVEEAQIALDRAVELDPADFAARREAAEAAYDRRDYNGALGRIGPLLADWPGDFRSRMVQANSLRGLGRKGEAKAAFEALKAVEAARAPLSGLIDAVQAPGASADDHYRLGKMLLEHEDRGEGRAYLTAAVRLDPRHGPAHAALARYHEAAGDAASAARHRREAARAGVAVPPAGGAAAKSP